MWPELKEFQITDENTAGRVRLREAGVNVESVGTDEGDLLTRIHCQKLDSCHHPSGPVKPMNRTLQEYSDLIYLSVVFKKRLYLPLYVRMDLRGDPFLKLYLQNITVLLAMACFGHRT